MIISSKPSPYEVAKASDSVDLARRSVLPLRCVISGIGGPGSLLGVVPWLGNFCLMLFVVVIFQKALFL